ncbi:MAG: phosphotransferase [Chloroflexi bacterium]|nr:phosphotransferase [Chloroflexota bacterium]
MTDVLWNKADLHVHSTYSDGIHDIPTLLEHTAVHTDIRILAITDHDCIDGALEARFLAPRYGLQVVVGQEVSTARGHLLALFTRELIPQGLSIPETVACARAQGGLAVLAHPYDRVANSPARHRPRPTREEWRAFGLDGLEELNGSQMDPTANVRAALLKDELGIAGTGGSDAHHKGMLGVAYTLYQGETVADLRRAIEARTCLAAGRRWTLMGYASWFTRVFVPRTWRSLRGASPVQA